MGIYDTQVDPFAVTPTARKTPATAVDADLAEPSSDPTPEPVDGVAGGPETLPLTTDETHTLLSLPRVPEEFRSLFSKSALAALERDEAATVDDEPGAKKKRKTASLKNVDRNAIELCLRLREQVQHNMDTFVTPGSAKRVLITDAWIVDADRMLRLDGIEMPRAVEVIEWSTNDPFWRSNIRSMPTLREQVGRLMMDDKFLKWREKAGLVQWPASVVAICQSMAKLLDYTYPGESHQPHPLWFRGTSDLLKKYTVTDIKDMMEWSLTSPRHISNVGSLLLFGWVSDGIRHDNGFILWSKEKGRDWARGARALESSSGARSWVNGKEKAKRIGGKVAGDEVFAAYEAANPTPVDTAR